MSIHTVCATLAPDTSQKNKESLGGYCAIDNTWLKDSIKSVLYAHRLT